MRSAHFREQNLLVITELVVSGTQCILSIANTRDIHTC